MSAEGKRNSSENENMCVVCFKNVEIYSIGICDHPVCFECSTRMRVLCRQNECPICRQDLPKVIFCYNVQPFRNLKAQHLNPHLVDHKFGIWFESPDFQKAYYQLLDHNCKKCDKYNPFRNFAQLKDHMRKDHELHYCDLCVTNLRIFTWERRCYTRSELAQHRRKGDTDNTSHRGHPLCEFCDTRYMDSDELFRHLRRDHLFCHFCDADGFHHYYPSYECLRQHFDSEHYLCEEGDCINEKFTSVFRTVIDLKAHRASVHGKHLGKAASKQARTLELEFTLKPRPRPELVSNRSNRKPQAPSVTNSNSERERFEEIEGAVGYEPYYTEPGGSRGATLTAQDFPTLGGSATTAPALRAPSGNITIRQITRGQKGLVKTNDNFPALSGDSSTVRFSVNSSTTTVDSRERIQATTTTTSAPNVSIHVNHRPNGAITTHISQTTSNSVRVRPRPDAFPALGGSAIVQAAQWVKQPSPKEPKPKVSKVTPAPLLPLRDSATDFPTLSNNKIEQKLKKSSLVNVPVSNTWVSEQAEPHTTTESKNNKSKKKKTKNTTSNHQNNNNSNSNNNNSSEKNPNQNKTISASVTKSKENKKEPKNESQEDYKNDVKQQQLPVKQQQNGVKKRSELKIDSLHISDPSTSNGHDDFPSLSVSKSKPPPGFAAVQAPPGFAANDLTFTNSSGQSYSILPAQEFSPPPNFTQRNQNLVESFKRALKADDAMAEFRTLSGMFRNNLFASEEYYNHCKQVMRNDFSNIFPELLVLLPNIEKQQELYTIHCKDSANKRGLDVCATCNQIVSTSDLRSHLATHSLQNHFPALGSQDLSTVWRK